ncbi:glycoside hydrolase family 5 protein [Cohnella faecalis]|nr:cellulase family glycosylhydrolase [Cohnella faecalis]
MQRLIVKGNQIATSDGKEVKLRGANIGAWMNLENFLNGYPGSESALRNEFALRLGESGAAHFFERLLSGMFSEEDVVFLKACGMNVLRIPVNYRHFESDLQPFVYREEGFKLLDQALEWCEKHEMYAILDMHTAPGFQSPDWHSDNSSQRAYFWEHIQFQDRFITLWEHFAARYRGRAVIAGFDLLNEPVSNASYGRFPAQYRSDWDKINGVYRRAVEAIRAIDAERILILEGDYLGFYFEGFEAPFAEHLVYSSHLYPPPAVKEGHYPGVIDGEEWDKEKLRQAFFESEGAQFARKHNVPLLVGEFGALYIHPEELESRNRALGDMIEAFEDFGAHWTVWTFKDIGHMGLLQIDPSSEYARMIAPLLQVEYAFNRDDGWGRQQVAVMADRMKEAIEDAGIDRDLNRYFLEMSVRENYLQVLLLPSYVKLFEGQTPERIESILEAFREDRCLRHDSLGVVKRFLNS